MGAGRDARGDRRATNAATNAALRSPEMLASMQRLGIAPSIGTVKDFADFIADETPAMGRDRKGQQRTQIE